MCNLENNWHNGGNGMVRIKLLVVICILGLFSFVLGCAGAKGASVAKGPSVTCPPEGTEVPFAKLMNSGFRKEYNRCVVMTKVSFLTTAQKMGCGCCGGKKGFTNFQAVPPGQAGEKNPLTGAMSGEVVYIANSKSDLVFELKPGDMIEMKGAVILGDYSGYPCASFTALSLKKIQ
jgi:hypothetical protein